MNRNQLNTLILSIIVAVAIIFANYHFIVTPKKEEIKKTKKEIGELDAKIAKAKMYKRKIAELEKKYKKTSQELEKLETKLPRKEDIPNLIRSIAKLAYYSGINFLSLQLKKEIPKPEEYYAIINLNVKFTATYNQFMAFLYSIDSLPRLLKPYKFSITSSSVASANPVLTINGVLQTFRFLEPKEIEQLKKKKRKKKWKEE